jgi:hypothetical protein
VAPRAAGSSVLRLSRTRSRGTSIPWKDQYSYGFDSQTGAEFLGASRRSRSAGGAQIVGRRLARAAIGYDLVADLLAFTQRSKSGTLYGADVHEHVVAAVIRLNKAEALGRVRFRL